MLEISQHSIELQTEVHPMNGDTEIVVSGREYKVPGHIVSYEEIVKIWNELHQKEGVHIVGTPGIDYEDDLKGEDGVLLPGKFVDVKDGTSFSVDPEHRLVMDRLSAFGEKVGFTVHIESDIVRAVEIPCLLQNGNVSRCTIEKSFDPERGRPDSRSGAVHAVRISTDEELDGRVYHADGSPIGHYVSGGWKVVVEHLYQEGQ